MLYQYVLISVYDPMTSCHVDTTSSCNVRLHLGASFIYSRVFSPVTKSEKSTVNKPEVFQVVLVCSCLYTYGQKTYPFMVAPSVLSRSFCWLNSRELLLQLQTTSSLLQQ